MSGPECAQDRRDLWDAVSKQREQANRIEVALVRIETLLIERCGICTRTQAEHGERIASLEESENKRKGGLSVLLGAASAAGAVAAIIIKAVWR